jgi:Bacterial Ig-like domain (group 3)
VRARTTLAAATLAVATGAALMATAPVAANAAAAPSVTVSPHTNLTNGQKVTVTAKNFTAAVTAKSATAAECSHAALKSKSISDCDVSTATPVPVNTSGNGSATFTIVSGATYTDMNGGKCGGNNACIITVVDTPFGTTQEAAAPITFKGAKVAKKATHTKITGKDSVDKGKKITLKIKTTHKGAGKLSGKVTIRANGKKIASVKEKKSGKLTVKLSFKKTGKEKIVAHYGGNKKFKASSGKKTIKVTKS